MKKVTLLQLYKDAESLLTKHGINVDNQSKLSVSVSLEKDHHDPDAGLEYVIQFVTKKDDEDYLFSWGCTAKDVLQKLEIRIKEKLNIKDDLDNIIIE